DGAQGRDPTFAFSAVPAVHSDAARNHNRVSPPQATGGGAIGCLGSERMTMGRKIKILIVTDSAVLPTGMAETTRLVFGNLLEKYPETYDIHQIGWFHCYAVTENK